MDRRITNVDEMFDILSSMNAGKFATFCYVNVAKIKKTKRSIDIDAFGKDLDNNRQDGDDYWYNPLKSFQQDEKIKKNPIYAIISVTRYNLNWSTEDSYKNAYSKYSKEKDEIDKKWGIYKEPEERRQGTYTKSNTMGLAMGNTDNTRNTAYLRQNTFNSRKKTTYYVINSDGKIQGEIPFGAIRSLITVQAPEGVSALKKLQKTDEEIKEYLDEINKLKFKPRNFIVDKILYIVATINGEKIFFINDRLPSDINNINVDAQSFINMVKNSFKQASQEITECYRKFKNIIFENKIRKALKNTLNEFFKKGIL